MDTLFSGPDCVLIILCDDTVRTDSNSTDFHFLQTSFVVPTLETASDTMDYL